MGKHTARPRSGRTVPTLGTCCGTLAVAAVVAALQPAVAPLPQADRTPVAADDRQWGAVDESPPAGGPLEVPTIGVVVSDYDERYAALTAARLTPAAPEPIASSRVAGPTEEPIPAPPAEPPPAPPAALPAPAVPPQPTASPPPTASSEPTASPQPTASSEPTVPPQPTVSSEEPAEPPSRAAAAVPSTPPPSVTETPPSASETRPSATATPPSATETPPPPEETPPPAEETPPADEESPPPAPEPPGSRKLALGEVYEQRDDAGHVVFSISLERIAVDLPCPAADALPAENGHLTGLELRVLAGPAGSESPEIRAGDFRFIGPDGGTVSDVATDSAAACLDEAAAWPSGRPGPEQPVAGTIVLDVPAVTGTIVYRPASWSSGLRWRVA